MRSRVCSGSRDPAFPQCVGLNGGRQVDHRRLETSRSVVKQPKRLGYYPGGDGGRDGSDHELISHSPVGRFDSGGEPCHPELELVGFCPERFAGTWRDNAGWVI